MGEAGRNLVAEDVSWQGPGRKGGELHVSARTHPLIVESVISLITWVPSTPDIQQTSWNGPLQAFASSSPSWPHVSFLFSTVFHAYYQITNHPQSWWLNWWFNFLTLLEGQFSARQGWGDQESQPCCLNSCVPYGLSCTRKAQPSFWIAGPQE